MSRAASRSKRSRSTVMERGARDATPIRTSRAVSVSRTPLDVPRAAFAEQFAAPTAWSSVCVTRTPLHDNEAGLRYRDAAPNVRCGVRLRKLPLDSSGAELLRRHTAPEGWSGVLLLTLDRHPGVAEKRCINCQTGAFRGYLLGGLAHFAHLKPTFSPKRAEISRTPWHPCVSV